MPTSFKNSPYFLCHYGVKGQKHGIRRYQNEDGSYTSLGRDHYGIGDPRLASYKQNLAAASRGRTVGTVRQRAERKVNGSNDEKDSDYYRDKMNEHANKAAKSAVTSFIAGIANNKLTLDMLNGNSGHGLKSLLNTAAAAVKIGSGISAAAHTTAWAYNAIKKNKLEKKKSNDDKDAKNAEDDIQAKKDEPKTVKESKPKKDKGSTVKKESLISKNKNDSKKEPEGKYANTKMSQKKAIETAYNDLEKLYPNYWQMPDSKRDKLWIDYVNKSGLSKWF